MYSIYATSLDEWKDSARALLALNAPPTDVNWEDGSQSALFKEDVPADAPRAEFSVPKSFAELMKYTSCHRDFAKWDLLYQMLWRITHGERVLPELVSDPTTRALNMMMKQVRRDGHKTKAFVRFRKIEDESGERYVAWHKPDHFILPLVAPFFKRRFSSMRWAILTPDQSVTWDGEALRFGPGAAATDAPQGDDLEILWKQYYRSTFNPARIKIKMMKSEMPVRHWQTLPEAEIIDEILAEAPERVQEMIKYATPSPTAAPYLPEDITVPALKIAADACKGCDLCERATQTVFGEGNPNARLMIIGEQPGDEEDRKGRPFVGPAGDLLDGAFRAAGISRDDIYLTNAVKHFRYSLRDDGLRQHRSPSPSHIRACKPWLEAEIQAVKPAAMLCLGVTAARSLIHPSFTLKDNLGKWTGDAPHVAATYHPSAILRAGAARQDSYMQQLIADVTHAKKWLSQ